MSSVLFSKIQKLKNEINYLKDSKDKIIKSAAISGDVRRSAERSVFLCTEILLDIIDMILTEKKIPKPDSYSDAIYKMGEYKIIPGEFAYKILYMAGLRNMLAHDYQKDTIHKIIEFLDSGIADLEKFLNFIGY